MSEKVPDSPPAALPPGLDLLWGRRETGRRGPKRGLSVGAIVDAAIRVADREGLEAVSMARVAAEVGFTTMSLYRYVSGKEELLQLMWNASAQGAEDLVLDGEGWRARLRSWALRQRETIDRHPWITQMPMPAPPLAPNSLTFVERGLETLDDTGLSDADCLRVIGLISSYTLSEARMAADAVRAAQARRAPASGDGREPAPESGAASAPATSSLATGSAPAAAPVAGRSFEALLRELIDQEHYPRLYRIAWSADIGPDPSGFEERAEFLFGLERILDGVQCLVAQRQPDLQPPTDHRAGR